MFGGRMNILVIGGSGLLGTRTALAALSHGHTVSILARGNSELQPEIASKVRFMSGDIYAMQDGELQAAVTAHDAVVYSMGIDDRHLHHRPSYDEFHADHVTMCMKVLRIARENGVRKFVVFGSYFTYFDRVFPEMELAKHHVYIRTRCEQRDAVLGESRPDFETFMLELPYIIGYLPGKVPPWTFLFTMLAARGQRALLFSTGGTAAVTAAQVGEAAVGAIERGTGGTAYPIAGCNLTWADFAHTFFNVTNRPKRLIGLSPVMFRLFGIVNSFILYLRGRERGLSIHHFADFQYMDAFIDPEPTMKALGYAHADYGKELSELITEWTRINGVKRADHLPPEERSTESGIQG